MLNTVKDLKEKTVYLIDQYTDEIFEHDTHMIETFPDTDFIHTTRKCGTDIFMFSDASLYPNKDEKQPFAFTTLNREDILKNICFIVRTILMDENIIMIHHKTKDGIKRVNEEKGIDLVNEYELMISNIWKNE